MFRIKHSVQSRTGEILSDETLAATFSQAGLATPFIEELVSTFDRRGFDKRNGRWWATDKKRPREIHFWWVFFEEDFTR